MVRQSRGTPLALPPPRLVSVKDLYLDPSNPRLADYEYTVDDQDKIGKSLWQDRAVNEIVDSIRSSGYWQHEELFADKEGGKLVVVEGNRRLAAVKILTDDSLRNYIGITIHPPITQHEKDRLQSLPVITCSREDVWQYIGFKHVNGPQDWDSIAKAQYIADVHNTYRIPLEQIARTIGDRHDTVRRLYRGLMVLNQAEKTGVFNRKDCANTRFAYSHLWTGLGYSGIQEFLGLESEKGFKPDPVPKAKIGNLGDLCRWMYGSKKQKKSPLIRSQNPDLRYLDEVLGTNAGIAALRKNLPLETSLKASRGDERLFMEAMVVVEQGIKEARGLVLTGYHGDSELLKRAESIYRIAESIWKEMQEKHLSEGVGPNVKRKRGRG